MNIANSLLSTVVKKIDVSPYYVSNDYSCAVFNADSFYLLPKLRSAGVVGGIVSDPPYGIDHDTDYTRCGYHRKYGSGTEWDKPIVNDKELVDGKRCVWLMLDCHVPTVIFGYNCFANILPCGTALVWDKRAPKRVTSFFSDGEIAWMNRGHGLYIFTHTWDGAVRASEKGKKYHPTQKPVKVMEWILDKVYNSTMKKSRAIVVDPFCGSGGTLLACRNLGIPCIGIELDKKYCETIATRMELGSEKG